MSTLSIHIDESGNTDMKDTSGTTYCITFVFHDQKYSIEPHIESLDNALLQTGLAIPFIHSTPLIRNKPPFDIFSPTERIRLFRLFYDFTCKLPIIYKSFFFDKHMFQTREDLQNAMMKSIALFVDSNRDFLSAYDNIKIYYDSGQNIVEKALTVFSQKLSGVINITARQEKYRLLQVADLICTLEQINRSWDAGNPSKSSKKFFKSKAFFKKNYYSRIKEKSFDKARKNHA